MANKRIVFDTNTLVDFICFENSIGYRAVIQALLAEVEIVFTHETFAELAEVMNRPKFDRYASPTLRLEAVEMIQGLAIFYMSLETVRECRDPKDNKFLEVALASDADLIVSRDKDLSVLNPWRRTPVVTPAVYLTS